MEAVDKLAVLVIGGLDPQGCAGISVDQLTVQFHGLHPVPLVTCLTQQTQSGLSNLGALSAEQFMQQYQCCVADFDIAAIKIGLIPNLEIARCIKHIIDEHDVPVVMDPVLAASSGGLSTDEELIHYFNEHLIHKLTLLTPNLPELTRLVQHVNDPEESSNTLLKQGLNACLVKGGHADSEWATDYFVDHTDRFFCYQSKLSFSVRGTGCALASSLACYLAKGEDIKDAVILAKTYISRGIRLSQQMGLYRILHHDTDEFELCDFPKLCYRAELVGRHFDFPRCPDSLGVYPVVDSARWVENVIKEGIKTVQLRIKDGDMEVQHDEITRAVKVSQRYEDIALFINDHWQLAIESGAYGIHLGQEDLHSANLIQIQQAGLRLGVSTHSYWELARALAVNPSYIALGPIFDTTSKKMPFSSQGIEKLQKWVKLLDGYYPLVAIGGINIERARMLKQTGAGSIAMISAITLAEDYRSAIHRLQSIWQDAAE